MHQFTKALIHGLSWYGEVKQDPSTANHRKLVSLITVLAKSSVTKTNNRKLQYDDEDVDKYDPNMYGMGSMEGAGDFDYSDEYEDGLSMNGFLDPEVAGALATCNIDLDVMFGELMVGNMMGQLGGMMEGEGFGEEDDELNDEELGEGLDLLNLEDGDDFLSGFLGNGNGDFLSIFAETDEEECTEEQVAQFQDATESFYSCTGWDKLAEGLNSGLLDNLDDSCGNPLDLDFPDTASMNFMEPKTAMESLKLDEETKIKCQEAVLGDNPAGNFLRSLYHETDVICGCVSSFTDAIPQCILEIDVPDDSLLQEAEEAIDMEASSFKIPLSLIKKFSCLVDLVCDTVDDFCNEEFVALDVCLAPMDTSTFSCVDTIERCLLVDEEMILLAPRQLTLGRMPDSCYRVYDAQPKNQIMERFTLFNQECNGISAPVQDSVEEMEATQEEESSSDEEEFDEESSSESSSSDEGEEEADIDEESSSESSSSDEEEGKPPVADPVTVALGAAASETTTTSSSESSASGTNGTALAMVGFACLALIATFLIFRQRRLASQADKKFTTHSVISQEEVGGFMA